MVESLRSDVFKKGLFDTIAHGRHNTLFDACSPPRVGSTFISFCLDQTGSLRPERRRS